MTKSKKSHIISDTLDSLENQLDPKTFFRANRQFILSAACVSKVEPYFNQKLIVKVDPQYEQEITISKIKATAFKAWLNS
jgi:two-component system, LytTR family, response regulator LytT